MALGRVRRNHAEIVRIIKFTIQRSREQTNEHLLSLHGDRHRRRHHSCAVAADDQVDLVDVEQLCINARYRRRIGLIIIIDKLHGTAEQPTFGISVLFPNLLGEQRRLSIGREPARQCHSVANLDRLPTLRCGRGGEGRSDDKSQDSAMEKSDEVAPLHCSPEG